MAKRQHVWGCFTRRFVQIITVESNLLQQRWPGILVAFEHQATYHLFDEANTPIGHPIGLWVLWCGVTFNSHATVRAPLTHPHSSPDL